MMLTALLDEAQGDERRTSDLRWADRMMRNPRRGLIATWALKGVEHRYPVEMLRLRHFHVSGSLMTVTEARLRLVEQQLERQRVSDAIEDDPALRCIQAWILEATEQEVEWER